MPRDMQVSRWQASGIQQPASRVSNYFTAAEIDKKPGNLGLLKGEKIDGPASTETAPLLNDSLAMLRNLEYQSTTELLFASPGAKEQGIEVRLSACASDAATGFDRRQHRIRLILALLQTIAQKSGEEDASREGVSLT